MAQPLTEEQETLNQGLHDLLLLQVQAQSRGSPQREQVQGMLDQLERAAQLRGPSRSNYRLQAWCHHQRGEKERGQERERRAEGPELSTTDLDHFLRAEDYRSRAESLLKVLGEKAHERPEREQMLQLAIEQYHQALRINPSYFWYYFQLGRCYLSLGSGSEANEALNTCVALRPSQPWGYSTRGLLLGLIGRFADGESDLGKALELDANFLPALLNRGILAWLQGKHERALADFGKVLNPPEGKGLIEAAYYRGQLQLEQGKTKEALEDLDRVVQENPGFSAVYLTRAQAHYLCGDADKGLADLDTFLVLGEPGLDRRSREAAALRGRILLRLVTAGSWRPRCSRPSPNCKQRGIRGSARRRCSMTWELSWRSFRSQARHSRIMRRRCKRLSRPSGSGF